MTAAEKPGDPADRATDAKADGAFGGLTNHRGGYGDDKLSRLIDWLRKRPDMTLASGEGGLLLAEIDRLRVRCRQIDDEAYDYAEQIERQKEEIDRMRVAAKDSADHYADARAEIDRLRAAIARVRARHYSIRSYDYDEDAQFCKECGADFPCPTLRTLDRDV